MSICLPPNRAEGRPAVSEAIRPWERWNANGVVRKSITYETLLEAMANYGHAAVKAEVADLPSTNDRANYFFHNNRGQLVYSVDAGGAVARHEYDAQGRAFRTTHYAVLIGNMTGVPLDHPWWMDNWADANGANARVRLRN